MKSNRLGFTLVELAIVLTIIGLVIGGVLVGRDMIEGAATHSQVAQIEKFNNAKNAFRVKYNYWPGDIPDPYATNFAFAPRGTGRGQGDGDGILMGGLWYGAGGHAVGVGETQMFWVDLAKAGLIDGTYIGSPNTASAADITGAAVAQYLPRSKVAEDNFIYIWASGIVTGGVYTSLGVNYYGISAVTTMENNSNAGKLVSAPRIRVRQASSIDTKMDDGMPITGAVLSIYVSNDPGWSNGTNTLYNPPPTQLAGSNNTCFDNNNVLNDPMQYSVRFQDGSNRRCALSFRF